MEQGTGARERQETGLGAARTYWLLWDSGQEPIALYGQVWASNRRCIILKECCSMSVHSLAGQKKRPRRETSGACLPSRGLGARPWEAGCS